MSEQIEQEAKKEVIFFSALVRKVLFVPQVPHHKFTLPFKCFAYNLIQWNLLPSGQVKRNKAKEAFDAKKAAKAIKNAARNAQYLSVKEGEPCSYNIIKFINSLHSVGGSSCTTGAICRGIIRNRRARDYNSRYDPGVDPAQSVAVWGVIMECKASVDGWSYRVRADDTRRNIIWVPEARVHRLKAAVFNFRKAQVASTHI
jgi:hypothetical protein